MALEDRLKKEGKLVPGKIRASAIPVKLNCTK
jgi:hypothetical protein